MATRRITFVIGTSGIGGIERHVLGLMRLIDRAKFTPSLLIMDTADGPVAQEAAQMDVPIICTGRRHPTTHIFAIARALGESNPDLVHCHEMRTPLAIAMSRFRRVPWIQTEHCSLAHAPHPRRARLLWGVFAPRIAGVTAVSGSTATALSTIARVPRPRIAVIPNGIDLTRIGKPNAQALRRELKLTADKKIIGTVGRLVHQKGMDDFLAGARFLCDRRDDVHFVIAGDGPDRPSLERQAESIANRVHFLGARNDALELMAGFDLFGLCSRHEELPTTLLEAFAVGTCVAGFVPLGGAEEVLAGAAKPCCRLIPTRSPGDLAEAWHHLLEKPSERTLLSRNARELILPRYTLEKSVRVYEELYEAAVGAKQ